MTAYTVSHGQIDVLLWAAGAGAAPASAVATGAWSPSGGAWIPIHGSWQFLDQENASLAGRVLLKENLRSVREQGGSRANGSILPDAYVEYEYLEPKNYGEITLGDAARALIDYISQSDGCSDWESTEAGEIAREIGKYLLTQVEGFDEASVLDMEREEK